MGGQQWVKMVGEKGNYVELLGKPSDNNEATRSNGYASVLGQFDGLKKVAEQVANGIAPKATTRWARCCRPIPTSSA